MSKTLLFLMLAGLSNFAFADYFGCELNVDGLGKVDVEAEYRGREVSVSLAGFECESMIDGNINVHVALTYPELNASSSVIDRASARTSLKLQNPEGRLGDYISATCTCGLR